MKGIEVIGPGLMTTVQDRGRPGFRRYGVPVAGPMDSRSAGLANRLVGNDDDCALLECTLAGPTLRFQETAVIAVTGAICPIDVDGTEVPRGKATLIPAGSVVRVGSATIGMRMYLAVAGGIAVTRVLSSRSASPRAGLGLPPIGRGTILPVGNGTVTPPGAGRIRVPDTWLSDDTVRVRPGPEFDRLTPDDARSLIEGYCTVSPACDRMGSRLACRTPARVTNTDIEPSGVLPGTIQMLPGGQPVVLMMDAQTTGGYWRVLQVVTEDLPVVGQRRPGDRLGFRLIEPL